MSSKIHTPLCIQSRNDESSSSFYWPCSFDILSWLLADQTFLFSFSNPLSFPTRNLFSPFFMRDLFTNQGTNELHSLKVNTTISELESESDVTKRENASPPANLLFSPFFSLSPAPSFEFKPHHDRTWMNVHTNPSLTSSHAPLTAASIVDAKLSQLQTRLGFLWSAAHSPTIAVGMPQLASIYIRQLRTIAFHNDITLSTPHTQLTYCTNCCQVQIPGLNSSVEVSVSRERLKRKKQSRVRAEKKKRQKLEQEKHNNDQAPQHVDGDAAGARVRQRSPSVSKDRISTLSSSPSPSSSPGPNNLGPTYAAHEVVSRCHTCKHVDYAPGISIRNRQLLRESNTDLASLVSSEVARQAQPALDELAARKEEEAARTNRLRASLQSQSTHSVPSIMKVNASATDLLAKAKERFEQSRVAMAAGAPPPTLPTNSFFADQMKAAAGVTASAPIANKPFSFSASKSSPMPQAPTAAPFSFSRAGARAPKPTSGSSSLYSLLNPTASGPSATPASAAPFVHSASKKPVNNNPSKPTPPAAATIQGIQIVGGMKSIGAGSKTYSIPVKGNKNNKR